MPRRELTAAFNERFGRLAHLLDFESAQVVCEFLHDEAVRINRAEWSEDETANWANGICSSIY